MRESRARHHETAPLYSPEEKEERKQAIKSTAKAAAQEVGGAVAGVGQMIGGPSAGTAAQQAVDVVTSEELRKAEGRSLPYRAITTATEMLGIPTGAKGEEEAAARGDTAGVVGHALGAGVVGVGATVGLGGRGGEEGGTALGRPAEPPEDAEPPEGAEPLREMNRETVNDLMDLGYSRSQITNLGTITEIRRIIANKIPAPPEPVIGATEPKPTPKPAEVSPTTAAEQVAKAPAAEGGEVPDHITFDKTAGSKEVAPPAQDERRDLSTRIFPSGRKTGVGRLADTTFNLIRQYEAEAKSAVETEGEKPTPPTTDMHGVPLPTSVAKGHGVEPIKALEVIHNARSANPTHEPFFQVTIGPAATQGVSFDTAKAFSPENRTYNFSTRAEAQSFVDSLQPKAAGEPTIEHVENASPFLDPSKPGVPGQNIVRLMQNGKEVGRVNYKIEGTTAAITGSYVDPKLQGKGYAQQMYLQAADKARAAGATSLTSDLQGSTTMDAARVWDRLTDKGHAVEKVPSKLGSPGYKMDLTQPGAPKGGFPTWLQKPLAVDAQTHAQSVPEIPGAEGARRRIAKPDVPITALSDSMAKLGGKMVTPPPATTPTVNPVDAPAAIAPMPKLDRTQIQGGTSTQPYPTYHEASGDQTNPWVRRSVDPANSASPTNENRLLMVQFASDLINKGATEVKDDASNYYDKLYSGVRPGYARMQDFWEIPQWHGFVARNFPDADVYVVRDMEQAKQFLNDAKYGRVTFSALDVNKHLIRDLAANYQGHIDVGGYVAPGTFSDLPNVKWHDSMESLTKDAGVEYRGGADYRHYAGSDVIPRLTMSKGCLHKCAFCTIEKQLVMPSSDDITQQADAIAQLGSKLVYLNDKTFGQAKNYQDLAELNTRMKEKNPNFQGFVVQTTAAQLGKIPSEWLAKSGIKYVEIGVESYNDPILKAMHKPATESLINKTVDKLRQNNITMIPNILIGYPGETAETYAHTLQFLQDNRDIISHANIYNLALYENTELGKTMTTASPGDFNENVLEKSFHKDPALHQQFAGDLYGMASKLLEAKPTPLQAPPEPQFWDALARRDQMPGQDVNLSEAYGKTGGYVGGHVEHRLDGKTREEVHQAYVDKLGVTHGPEWESVIPEETLAEGNTRHSVVTHEDGHVVEAARVGWPTDGLVVHSPLHPGVSAGAAGATDFGPVFRQLPGVTETEPGRFHFSAQALKDNWTKALRVYLAGAVSQEQIHGIPFNSESGSAYGDVRVLHQLGKAMGLTPKEIQGGIDSTLTTLRKDWSDPAVNGIVKQMSAVREDGLSKALLQSEDRVQDLLRQVRQVWEAQKHGDVERDNAADGGVVPEAKPGDAGRGAAGDTGEDTGEAQGKLFTQKGVNLFAQAVKQYGTTDDIKKAGYVGLDGSMLDFSEGQATRTLDHGDIASIPGVQSAHNSNPRFDFVMKTGAMRVIDIPRSKYLGLMISANHPPTHDQLDRVLPLLADGRQVDIDLIHPDWAQPGGASAKDVHDMDGLQRVIRDAQKESGVSGAVEARKGPWQQIVDLHNTTGGSTYNIAQGKNMMGTDTYAVAIHPDRSLSVSGELKPQVVQQYAKKNDDLLSQPTESLGTWNNKAAKTHVLDVVKTTPDRAEAVRLGFHHGQEAIYHLKDGGEGEIFLKNEARPIESPTVSTRVPTRTVKGETIEDHTNQSLISDMEAAKAAPGYVEKMVKRVQDIPGFVKPEGDAQTTADAYIRHAADNIKFNYHKLTPAEIAYNEQWYPVGAHERGLDVAKTHGITPNQAWAVTSVESPMTDWDQNTALAERTADIWKNQQNTKFTPEMRKAADEILGVPAMAKFAPLFKSLQGKTLAGLASTPEKQAWWLRLYDEGHNPRSYQTWGPDGKQRGLAKNVDGSDAAVGWSFQNHIQKALSILSDGSPENISKQLGYGHKVRNFYNNQAAPDDPRFLTIDTHAVAAAQLRPMSGKHPDVSSNFGTISNGPHGLSGTYPLHDAAYRLAAKELDIPIPSRLQSPVWAKIREVFTDDFKTEENLDAVDAIWRQHNDGKITADEARNQIWDYAARWHDAVASGVRNSTDQRELFESGVRGTPAKGTAGRGDRGGTSVANQEQGTPEVTSFARPKKLEQGGLSLSFLSGLSNLSNRGRFLPPK